MGVGTYWFERPYDMALKHIITSPGFDRITMKAPQIIGWVSQMLPALPRKNQSTVATNSGATSVAVTI